MKQRCSYLFWFVVLVLTNLFSSSSYAEKDVKSFENFLMKRIKFSDDRKDHHKAYHKAHDKCRVVNAPPYVKIKDGIPEMQIAVLNRSSLISSSLLKETLKVITKQVNRDFAPYYGIRVKFRVVKDQSLVNWSTTVVLAIPDLLLNGGGDFISFHNVQDSAGVNGTPLSFYIPDAPPISNGTPYIIVPIGTPNTPYGVLPAFLLNDPTLPPTFEGVFSSSVSHEVLETLADQFISTFYVFNNSTFTALDWYFSEVCDPVEFTPGYLINRVWVSNFVLPSFWNILEETGPYDFLNTVPAPLTPFNGETIFVQSTDCGTENFLKISIPTAIGGNPFDIIIIDEGSSFSCDFCSPNPQEVTSNTKERLMKKSGVYRSCQQILQLKGAQSKKQ